MNTPVIQAEGLGKRYRRGLGARRNETLRDALANFARSPLAALRRPQHETFWALQDVSLEVREGEVLGLIGRNGAGKTTLLKILSRITQPTTGWAEIRGRVRSLLEVGTGFHGELSGRENAYLSGSILGMSKREIDRKFDEIVAFAEIDKFIDTPVKHYSSGMYVRLAFAVAAHLEPEILLVDEVLAVGDINFQRKCLGKMGDVARAGRTVVLVSHQLNQIRRLCQRVVWIDAAYVRQDGPTHEVVSGYESAMARGDQDASQPLRGTGTKARFLKWEIAEPLGDDPNKLTTIAPTVIRFTAEIKQHLRRGVHGIALFNHDRQLIWGWATLETEIAPGLQEFCYSFPMLPVRPGPYNWLVSLYNDGEEVDVWECVPEMVVATEIHQHTHDHWNGFLNIPVGFSIQKPNKHEVEVRGDR
jgi:ABC-type polysaccharide/polyol phosphate transport system ATPase subunit